jgi:CBS domain containing-hemolysin-like protein
MRLIFGGVLCSLVFIFSLAAKVAMPQPGEATKPIASLKMQRKIPELSLQATPLIAAAVAFLLFAFGKIIPAQIAAEFSSAIELQAPAFQCWFSSYLSVRPPPSSI